MKICPGLKGYERYSKFFACALHTNPEDNKRKFFRDKVFIEKTTRQLQEFLSKYEFCDSELENYFNMYV